jgi:uncharacterized protein YqjF (DUF2071 family)
MLNFLKNHPFAVEAFFEHSIVVTFAIPKQELEVLIPECLTLDTFNDKWGFIAVAMVQTKGLRPKGFPKILGHDFFLTGYRIFTRYVNTKGKSLRGLYIIKSETNKRFMQTMGNFFTHYNYSTTDIEQHNEGQQIRLNSVRSGFHLHVRTSEDTVALPQESPFADWKEARRYAGPLPFTFTYDKEKKEILIIEGVRQNWTPSPLSVEHFDFPFLQSMGFSSIRLANAFIINNIPYYWKKGIIESWQP